MTKVQFAPFIRAHYNAIIQVGPPNGSDGADVDPNVLKYMEEGISFTLLVDDLPVAIGGILNTQYGKLAYGYITEKAGPYMLRIARFSRKILEISGPGEVVGTIQVGFAAGERFARMMGMQPKDTLPAEARGVMYRQFSVVRE